MSEIFLSEMKYWNTSFSFTQKVLLTMKSNILFWGTREKVKKMKD